MTVTVSAGLQTLHTGTAKQPGRYATGKCWKSGGQIKLSASIMNSKGTRDMLRQLAKRSVKTELVSVVNGVATIIQNPQI